MLHGVICLPTCGAGFQESDIDTVTIFGLVAVTAMLIFYALERRSHWFILAFAGACILASIYGFVQGAWPFGVVEAIWAVVAAQRWRSTARDPL